MVASRRLVLARQLHTDLVRDALLARRRPLVRLLRGDSPVADRYELTVNRPLKLGSFKIYQLGYEEIPPGSSSELSTVLEAVYDPGYVFIIWGALLLTAGLALLMVDKLKHLKGR